MIAVAGPFIGDFEQEVVTFRPYVRWCYETSECDKMYVNTHSNRMFLYDFLSDDNLIPVPEQLSRAEGEQKGYIHTLIAPKDFNILVKFFKDEVVLREGCNKRDLHKVMVNYVKSTAHYSVYKKTFTKIRNINIKNPYKGKVVFIPYGDRRKRLLYIKEFLKNYVIIGNQQTRFRDENVILNRIDYFSNGWKLMVKIITEAKAVICPVSFWTYICNLQQVPVFSWGENVGQFKEDGIYHFGNKKCTAIASMRNDILVKMIQHFLEEL
jgi:hypothetical protein